MTKIAIMQPTFLPWVGYFSMIDQVDKFVFLNSVQFSKRSWQQRNLVKTADGTSWMTIPVLSKGKSDQSINDTNIDNSRDWRRRISNSIISNYSKAPFFSTYSEEIMDGLTKPFSTISEINIFFIELLMKFLKINNTELLKSSALTSQGAKAELLANICEELESRKYLSAIGSKDYIEQTNFFEEKMIEVSYHNYNHPTYTQLYGGFKSHLSIIDLLFNEGPNSLEIIRTHNNILP